jgi:transposase InsO family protein
MSKLFDPLGWLAPVVISAKIYMQSLWKLDLGWDVQLPEWAIEQWKTFKEELTSLRQLHIPRCVRPTGSASLELVGFCDASERAYAAVVYIIVHRDNQCKLVSLISSKTRVAPVKTVCLPRLELCGAVLLSQLMANVRTALRLQFIRERAFTDSTIVLAWINRHPSSLHTFVANRVTEILANLRADSWFHVPGIDNPADCASRGISSEDLINHPLWWKGPSFLYETDQDCDIPVMTEAEQEAVQKEERPQIIAAATAIENDFRERMLNRYSSFSKFIRALAWVRRFVFFKILKRKNLFGPLSPEELRKTLHSVVIKVQLTSFADEVKLLSNGKDLPPKSKILSLNPFLDKDGILRVGGRLRHSPLPQDQKTPILLPRHHRLTELIITSTHVDQFHAGPQLIQSLLQQQFWILRAKDAIRFIVRKCITCRKLAASTAQTMMGDLPAARVTPGRAFNQCGVDYAGPFLIKSDAPRSKIKVKAYLCIFVCFATRAVHLEVATSLSTDAFLAALRRFVSRRNKPSCIHSDCGTNFVGAARELKDLISLVSSSSHNNKVADKMSDLGIEWRFNPPGAPHFGGLWEAGVKSVKHHLHRVLGPSLPTYEELSTLIIQIEATLNSRPLTAVSSSPDDLTALTPGHFLTGAALNAVPEADLLHLKTGRLDRWQMIQHMHQQFWTRWANEYITRMQNRPKWLQQRTTIKKDDLVIIKDERMGPQKWKMARVIILHPGADGIARVATLRTAEGEIKRPLVKLCLLPIDNSVSDGDDTV